MKISNVEHKGLLVGDGRDWSTENVVEVEKRSLRQIVEFICRNEQCRYPLLAVRVLIHIITGIDAHGRVNISARHLSKILDVHYDTVTKCLKYLREIDVLHFDKDCRVA